MRRVIIAGASSRSGKTTAACGLLACLKRRGLNVSAYKTGPDYIDREYLHMAGGCTAYNLDTWLMSEQRMLQLFSETSRGRDIAIIEGTMGLYDGGINNTASIAKLTHSPVILVVNARSMGESVAALALGYREYDRDVNIAGVILNFTGSDYHEEIIAGALMSRGIKYLGALRRDDSFTIPERHLGLLQAVENDAFDTGRLAAMFESCVDVDEILRIAGNVSELRPCGDVFPAGRYHVRVGVAHDEAFAFTYPESLTMLERLGAEIVTFSPLRDEGLPDADGYIFCGGYPEIFAEALAGNAPMLESVRQCRKPMLAECGGMMYLCRSLRDADGRLWDMAGVIPCESYMAGRAVMGYRVARALRDNVLCRAGDVIRGHEYHYSRVMPGYVEGACAFEFSRRDGSRVNYGGYARENVSVSCGECNLSSQHSDAGTSEAYCGGYARENISASCRGCNLSSQHSDAGTNESKCGGYARENVSVSCGECNLSSQHSDAGTSEAYCGEYVRENVSASCRKCNLPSQQSDADTNDSNYGGYARENASASCGGCNLSLQQSDTDTSESNYGGYVQENVSASCGGCNLTSQHSDTSESNCGGYARGNILASYLHINFFGNEKLAENFMNILTSSKV